MRVTRLAVCTFAWVLSSTACDGSSSTPLDAGALHDAGLDAGAPSRDAQVVTDAATPSVPCLSGSTLALVDSATLLGRHGSVFSRTLYVYDPAGEATMSNDTHQPAPVVVRVTDGAGAPVAGCEVAWEPGASSGWIFAASPTTDSDGRVSAWWTAGDAAEQTVTARISHADGTTSEATAHGSSMPHSTRSNSIHINYEVTGTYDAFSVDVTPVTFAPTTYYSTINFPGGYTGLQNTSSADGPAPLENQVVIFSVWDVGVVDAVVVDAAGSTCTGFGGEGTGARCMLQYAWELGHSYRFELEITYPVADRTDYAVWVSDATDPSAIVRRTHIATLRYGEHAEPWYASGFVEDWYVEAPSCLDNPERTVRFHDARYRYAGAWTDVRAASFGAVYNPWHDEICANYAYRADGDAFLWSSGGDLVDAPLMPGDPPPRVALP